MTELQNGCLLSMTTDMKLQQDQEGEGPGICECANRPKVEFEDINLCGKLGIVLFLYLFDIASFWRVFHLHRNVRTRGWYDSLKAQ